MEILIKLGKIALIIGFVYLWNRFIVKKMIRLVINFHKRHNQKNLHRQPVKFLVKNEGNIYKYYAAFFWLGAALMSYDILINE